MSTTEYHTHIQDKKIAQVYHIDKNDSGSAKMTATEAKAPKC